MSESMSGLGGAKPRWFDHKPLRASEVADAVRNLPATPIEKLSLLLELTSKNSGAPGSRDVWVDDRPTLTDVAAFLDLDLPEWEPTSRWWTRASILVAGLESEAGD